MSSSKEKKREYNRKWVSDNKERRRKWQREYDLKNKERKKSLRKANYAKNHNDKRSKHLEYYVKYSKENSQALKMYHQLLRIAFPGHMRELKNRRYHQRLYGDFAEANRARVKLEKSIKEYRNENAQIEIRANGRKSKTNTVAKYAGRSRKENHSGGG